MNKQKKLTNKLTKIAVMALGGLAFFGGAVYLTDGLIETTNQKKTEAEAAYNSTTSEIAALRTQLEKSGHAEEGFLKIQAERNNADYLADIESLVAMLRQARAQFRLSSAFKLTATTESTSDLQGLNYSMTMRPKMRAEFEAISDLHVLSFIRHLETQAPGFIRVDALTIKRKGEMDAAAISDMQRGATPFLVSATIDFGWIGIKEKTAAGTPGGGTP